MRNLRNFFLMATLLVFLSSWDSEKLSEKKTPGSSKPSMATMLCKVN